MREFTHLKTFEASEPVVSALVIRDVYVVATVKGIYAYGPEEKIREVFPGFEAKNDLTAELKKIAEKVSMMKHLHRVEDPCTSICPLADEAKELLARA